eukprot:TRINITY_DN74607_c0_g1_i1.p1 TRINITY_DN74607_c0_g1~~TRINITY_DN74607_c0_g1_i1.p1  ORF type:complete len:381 (-),score=31.58 TRINITY_DN74607_c0_g1_i1:207-1349(-)
MKSWGTSTGPLPPHQKLELLPGRVSRIDGSSSYDDGFTDLHSRVSVASFGPSSGRHFASYPVPSSPGASMFLASTISSPSASSSSKAVSPSAGGSSTPPAGICLLTDEHLQQVRPCLNRRRAAAKFLQKTVPSDTACAGLMPVELLDGNPWDGNEDLAREELAEWEKDYLLRRSKAIDETSRRADRGDGDSSSSRPLERLLRPAPAELDSLSDVVTECSLDVLVTERSSREWSRQQPQSRTPRRCFQTGLSSEAALPARVTPQRLVGPTWHSPSGPRSTDDGSLKGMLDQEVSVVTLASSPARGSFSSWSARSGDRGSIPSSSTSTRESASVELSRSACCINASVRSKSTTPARGKLNFDGDDDIISTPVPLLTIDRDGY